MVLNNDSDDSIIHEFHEEDEGEQTKVKRTKRSAVWKFFTIISEDNLIARCDLCNSNLSYRTAITNLKKHLRCKHSNISAAEYGVGAELESPPPTTSTQTHADDATEDGDIVDTNESDEESGTDNQPVKRNTRRSILWFYFTPVSDKGRMLAKCNICYQNFSYYNSTSNLKKHLIRKHWEVYETGEYRSKLPENISAQQNALDNIIEDCGIDESGEENGIDDQRATRNRWSALWNHFTIVDDRYKSLANCNICNRNISFRTSTSNMKKHLNRKHAEVSVEESIRLPEVSSMQKTLDDINEDSVDEFDPENSSSDEKCVVIKRIKKSVVWNYFSSVSDDEKQLAKCNICYQDISYHNSTSNLKKHLQRKHQDISLIPEDKSPTKLSSNQEEAVMSSDEDDACGNQESHDENESYKAGNKRSVLWNFFTDVSTRNRKWVARCNICSHNFSFKESVSNLQKHLMAKHPDISLNDYHFASALRLSSDQMIEVVEEPVFVSSSSKDVIHKRCKLSGTCLSEGIVKKRRLLDKIDEHESELQSILKQEAMLKVEIAKEQLKYNQIRSAIEQEKLEFDQEYHKLQLKIKSNELAQITRIPDY